MKSSRISLTSEIARSRTTTIRSAWRLKAGLAGLGAVAALISAQAQIQTAGTLFINVDATTNAAGAVPGNDIVNYGALGGVFESTNTTFIGTTGGVNAIVLAGTNFMRLLAAPAGALIPPPGGLVGSNATCSIEVWGLTPQVPGDQCMIAWGQRNTGQNMAFEYGNGSSGGAQHNGNDMVWDPVAGGAPLNNYWHHLVYTFDGTNQNLYSDGVLANSIQPPGFNIATNVGIAIGAQWITVGTNISTSPAFAKMAIARLRVHDGALTAAQVLNNYNVEAATFAPAFVTPQYLAHGPAHRYSFSESATNNAGGLAFHDSIGGGDGIVRGDSYGEIVSTFSGRRLVLLGGRQDTNSGIGAPFGDLPNGLVSANSTNNGGSGELSIEIWYKNYGGYPLEAYPLTYTGNGPLSWSRVFDIGSCGPTTGGSSQQGVEVSTVGSYPGANNGQLDYFIYAAQMGAGYSCVNQRQLGWQNKDIGPAGTTTNASSVTQNVQTMGTFRTDRHVVVTWKESTGVITAYENGVQVASITVPNNMAALNDINVWLGRSQSGTDTGFSGEYDEVRFYTNELSAGQALADFQVGPNTINTGAQSVTIITQPQSTTANQGWPVSLYVEASGSPAVSYQWKRNGTSVAGATNDTYSLTAASLTNNGDVYACVVSNSPSSVVTSSNGTLTVAANQAPPAAILYETRQANPAATALSAQRDEYSGVVGCFIQAPSAGALVTHLGFYDVRADGLNVNHRVGIFNSSGSTILGFVTVPSSGNDTGITYYTNGYRYVALNPPLMLAPNTSCILEGETFSGDGDMWADLWAPGLWNPYFVGTNPPSSRQGRYGGAWPSGATGVQGSPTTYGAANMAALPIGPAVVAMPVNAATQFVGLSITLNVLANGQAPLALQWYQGDPPSGALLNGQTGTSLVFTNVQATNQSDYYVIASNSLNTATSSVVFLRVFSDSAVAITQQPTNLTVPLGYGANFYISASGTPPIYYQWRRNGTNIASATNTSLSLAAVALTNNGDAYSCVVSNFANSSGHILTSSNAILTVVPNQAPPLEMLYGYVPGFRNNFSGTVGAKFMVGSSSAVVTHLGFYCTNIDVGLNNNHNVGIFDASGSTLLASVSVSAGADPAGVYASNGYAWVALAAPFVLNSNTTYILGAEIFNGDGDVWPDVFTPSDWNPYYVGTNGPSTRTALYGFSAWPVPPLNNSSANGIYGAPNMALLPIGPPEVTMAQTSVTQYQSFSVTLTAFVDGQAPMPVQWYKVGPPDKLLTNQVSSSLVLSNLALSDAGNYYLIATNIAGSTQGSNVSLTVLPLSGPIITSQPQSRGVYATQPASFTVGASGTPPLTYQWTFKAANGNTTNNLTGATNATLALTGVTAANAGNYQVTITNNYGSTNSAVAVLTLLSPTPSSYAAAVLNAAPLVYYRFSDVTNGTGAFNLGSLGAPNNGTYDGDFTNGPGPQPPTFPNFETTNLAVVLDGQTADVSIPAMNLDTSSGPNVTMAAWINSAGPQTNYAGVIFYRPLGQTNAAGFGTRQNSNSLDVIEYHWANQYFGFDSGLVVPSNQWVFAALVVQPSQAIIYLYNGLSVQTSTNNAGHGTVAFDSTSYPTHIGWDDNYLSGGDTINRRFNGSIDEPMIFARSLSANELDSIYLAAYPPLRLQISQSGGQVILSWPMGTLQQASQVTGPYMDMPSVTSPYTNSPTGTTNSYYRVRVPLQ